MSRRILRYMLALALLLALTSQALASALAEAADMAEAALPLSDEAFVSLEEEPAPEEQADFDLPADGDIVADEATEEALPGGEAADWIIPAEAELRVGYVAVAADATVYIDAAMTQPIGAFAAGGMAYAEAVDEAGAWLRVRFDTDYARAWALDIPSGYVAAGETLACDDLESAALARNLAADGSARALNGVWIPWAAFTEWTAQVAAGEAATGLGVAARSQADIQAFVNAWPSYRNQADLYAVAPKDEPYSVGMLSAVNQQSALNLLNQIRYIAGLDADVTLLPEREYMMAATALVLRLNGGLSHYPARPAALADAAYDALYAEAYTGAGSANIAMGYTVTGALLAYMSDADSRNVDTVGHRRWILNPLMGRTIFAANERFSAMYAHDRSGSGIQTKVAWPAQQMPVQYFSAGDPWSVSYGRALDAARVEVTLVRQGDGRTWHFSQAASDGFFNVENSYYGRPGCVIFRPDGLGAIAAGDVFNVAVTDGATGEVTRYTVNFFNLVLTGAMPLERLSVTAQKTNVGNLVSWSADSRAAGYYVLRREGDGRFGIVADIVGATSWLDADAPRDVQCSYQVWAHTDALTSRAADSVPAQAPAPTKVSLDRTGTVTLYTNATLRLFASLTPDYAESELTWTTSNKKVAKVDGNGLVTPLKAGTATITVKTANGKAATVRVKVTAPPKPTKVTLDRSGTVTLNLGDQLALTATVAPADAVTTISWSSSSKSVAKVSGGLVTALKEGTATITVKTKNGKKAKVKVKVVDPKKPTAVALNRSGTVTLAVGETLALNAALAPATAETTLTWTSSSKKVATVSGDGVVTALKAGSATITVKTKNGKKAKVKIKVVKAK